MNGKTPSQEWAMDLPNEVLVVIASCLSFIGCMITIITYLVFKDIQTSSRHILVCISISDFIVCLANINGLFKDPPDSPNKVDILCILQSFIGSSFVISSFLWTVALALFLYLTVVKENKDFADRLLWPWLHLICWLVPLAINVAALILGVLGNSGDASTSGWCWIALHDDKISRKTAILWMIFDGKGIEILSYILVIVFYGMVKRHLRKTIKGFRRTTSTTSSQFITQRTVDAAKTADRKLVFVPLCFVLLRLWGTIRFLLFIRGSKHNSDAFHDKVLLYLQAVGDNLQGFVNCVLFCFLTPKVWNHIKTFLQKYCCYSRCCSSSSKIEDSDMEEQIIPQFRH